MRVLSMVVVPLHFVYYGFLARFTLPQYHSTFPITVLTPLYAELAMSSAVRLSFALFRSWRSPVAGVLHHVAPEWQALRRHAACIRSTSGPGVLHRHARCGDGVGVWPVGLYVAVTGGHSHLLTATCRVKGAANRNG